MRKKTFLKPYFPTYNSGVLLVVAGKKEKTSFGATKNPTRKDDFDVVEKLDYGEMSKREEDLDFAESNGRTLTIKVKTRIRKYIRKNTHKVIIGNVLYDIFKADYSDEKRESYLYLEEERELSNDSP